MPTGVYKRSEGEKERLRKMIKSIAPIVPRGSRISPQTEFKKGMVPWNKGKPWPEMSGENHPSRKPENRAVFEKTWKQTKGIMRGKDHPQWRGGITPLIMKIRNSDNAREWREAIFKRDGYVCVSCLDDKGHNLNAHHIKRLSDLVFTMKIETAEQAFATKELWDVNNGMTLCEKCHATANEISKIANFLNETGGGYE